MSHDGVFVRLFVIIVYKPPDDLTGLLNCYHKALNIKLKLNFSLNSWKSLSNHLFVKLNRSCISVEMNC